MKRMSSLALGLVLVSGAMASLAGASERAGHVPARELAVGAGRFQGQSPIGKTDVLMLVNASRGPGGEGVTGRFSVHRWLPSELQLDGEVTCLNVVGNRATVGGRVDDARKGNWPGSGILITVVDNGGHGLDQMHGDPRSTPPAECPTPPQAARLPVQRGNFVVVDG